MSQDKTILARAKAYPANYISCDWAHRGALHQKVNSLRDEPSPQQASPNRRHQALDQNAQFSFHGEGSEVAQQFYLKQRDLSYGATPL